MTQKVLTVLGNRPQFIKAAVVSRALQAEGIQETIINTGQHFDYLMSDIFIKELSLPKASYNLNLSKMTDLQFISACIGALEPIFKQENPELVLVYGDTNSTLAATIAAKKLGARIAHVEAGPRLHDITIPEEYNRILVDHSSDFLFAPDQTSVNNLLKEGISKEKISFSGDVMLDIYLENEPNFNAESYLERFADYIVCTFHRQENVDNPNNLKRIIDLLLSLKSNIVFPIHPRTQKNLEKYNLLPLVQESKTIHLIQPLSYIEMMSLLKGAKAVLTDSGGLQKEAFFAKIPCYVFLTQTPWPEILETGWQKLLSLKDHNVLNVEEDFKNKIISSNLNNIFKSGTASKTISRIILES